MPLLCQHSEILSALLSEPRRREPGHAKAEFPHLLTIEDPEVLNAELERIRVHTTKPGSTKALATSPLMTNTKAEAKQSVKPAETARSPPTETAGTTDATPTNDHCHQPNQPA